MKFKAVRRLPFIFDEVRDFAEQKLRTKCQCKRIPAVRDLPFKVSENEGDKTQYHFKTIRLNDANGRGAILLHPGDGYEWSRGCILPMYTNELQKFKENPSAIISKRMSVDKADVANAGRVFVMSLVEYVEKRKMENPNIKLLIDIVDDENEGTLTTSTTEFDRISCAGEIFYQLDIASNINLTDIARGLVKKEIQSIANGITKLDEEVIKINNEIGGDKSKFNEGKVRERLNKVFEDNMKNIRINFNSNINNNPSIVNINKTKCENDIEVVVKEILNKNKDNKLFGDYTVSDILEDIIDDRFGAIKVNYALPSDVVARLKDGSIIIEELNKIKQSTIDELIIKIKAKNNI